MYTNPLLVSIIAFSLSSGAWATETSQTSEATKEPTADTIENQQDPTEETTQPQQPPAAEPPAVTYPVQASDLIGKQVRDPQGEEIGEVEDLRIEQDGQIYAIISVGGILGMGEESMAVPYNELRTAVGGEDYLIYTVPPKQENMPSTKQ